MAIIRWEPLNDLDKWFEDDLTPFAKGFNSDLASDLYREADNIVAKVHIPDVDPDKISVEVQDGYLSISGSREEEKEVKNKNYYRKEISSGTFKRSFRLPEEVDGKLAKASYDKGVLLVTIPVKKEIKATNKVKVEVKK